MSHSNPPPTMRSTVRQTPFTLIDSPSSSGASVVSIEGPRHRPPSPLPEDAGGLDETREHQPPAEPPSPVDQGQGGLGGALGPPHRDREAFGPPIVKQLVDEALGVGRQVGEEHAHAGRIVVDPHHLAEALDGLDVVHDHGEAQVHLGPDGERRPGSHEDAGARDVGDVLVDEGVVRLELFVDGDALFTARLVLGGGLGASPTLGGVWSGMALLHLPCRSNCSRWYSLRGTSSSRRWKRRSASVTATRSSLFRRSITAGCALTTIT